MTATARNLLVELFVEELPPKALNGFSEPIAAPKYKVIIIYFILILFIV
ncbi:MAG: hypothetical protein ACKO6D_01845 [Rubrivivax sp.]